MVLRFQIPVPLDCFVLIHTLLLRDVIRINVHCLESLGKQNCRSEVAVVTVVIGMINLHW